MNRKDPFADYYQCEGHYHRKIDGLMCNPFNGGVAPDQWCKNVVPDPTYARRRTQQVRSNSMAAFALWCKIGKHAFDPDDKGAEEFTRTIKVTDRWGDTQEQTKAFSVCSEHLGDSAVVTKAAISNGNEESVSQA